MTRPASSPNATATASVDARSRWSATGIRVEAGATYDLRANGTWHDRQIATDPDGYPSPTVLFRLVEWARRFSSARWFALVGTVDRRKRTRFVIGSGTRWTAPVSGELVCYANDLLLLIGNNSGSVRLTVRRVP